MKTKNTLDDLRTSEVRMKPVFPMRKRQETYQSVDGLSLYEDCSCGYKKVRIVKNGRVISDRIKFGKDCPFGKRHTK